MDPCEHVSPLPSTSWNGWVKQAWCAKLGEHDASMLWAAAVTCFFGFLRAGKVVVSSDSSFDPNIHLTAADISVDNHSSPSYLAIRIKASKTDPFRQGVTIYLGRTRGPTRSQITYTLTQSSFQNNKSVYKTTNQFSKQQISFQNKKPVFKTQISSQINFKTQISANHIFKS